MANFLGEQHFSDNQPQLDNNALDINLFLSHQPEIERTLAIHNYYNENGRDFQFAVGDEISVRERCELEYSEEIWWYGINLRTGQSGFFPPSHVAGVSFKPAKLCPPASSEEQELQRLTEQFHLHYGDDSDPRMTFRILQNMKGVASEDFWLSFQMLYPTTIASSMELHSVLSWLYNILFYSPYARFHLVECSAREYPWKFSQYYFNVNATGQWPTWELQKDGFQDAIRRASNAWKALKLELGKLEEPIPYLSGMEERLDVLVALLISQLDKTELKVRKCLEHDAQGVLEYQRRIYSGCDDVETTTHRTGATTSGTDIEKHPRDTENRSSTTSSNEECSTSNIRNKALLYRSLKSLGDDVWHSTTRNTRAILKRMGETPAVIATIIILSITSGIITGLAAWDCAPPSTFPTIDSNFWSTLASAIIGIASLYCNIIPILLEQQIKVQNELLFQGLLWTSFTTAIMSVIAYPYQTRASLVLLFLSGAAQLATTMQVVLGAVTKIQQMKFLLNSRRMRQLISGGGYSEGLTNTPDTTSNSAKAQRSHQGALSPVSSQCICHV